ncbi:unnamed protein product [Rhizopus stolonifer]
MDQQGFSENRGQIWQDIAHAAVPQLYAVYDAILDKNQKNAYQSVIEKEVKSIKLPTDQELALVRILNVYSQYDPQVGYCHGMAQWVLPLLNEMNEKETFATLTRLMETYELRELYINGLSQALDTFQLLLAQLCPELKHHLDQLRIHPSVYAASWFLSLFTQSPLPTQQIGRLYDHIFLEGALESCLRLSAYLMQKNEKKLQRATRTEIISHLQSPDFFAVCDFQDMMRLNHAIAHQITQSIDIRQTLSVLQRENTEFKMRAMEQEAAQHKLSKRNSVLEKRVKIYKVKLAHNAVQALPAPPVIKEEEMDKKGNFSSFVESLRGSGDFGALIAGAIMTDTKLPNLHHHSSSDEEEEDVEETEKKKQQAALQNVTSELVAVKMDHFETTQKYESLYRHCEHLNRQWQQAVESHAAMTQKIIYLSSELEDTTTERDQLYGDQEQVLEMAMVAKKTATELQLEKMTLSKEVERLEQCVTDLENEKQAYFMPRDTFSEEVFAAHNILFGQKKEQRRHTMAVLPTSPSDNEYKTKFAESELRCRELEKYLAEAKVKLAELESSLLYPPVRRTSSVHLKRSSTASMLARVSTPTTEPRASSESYASSTTSLTSINSSQYNSKRSSMYSRIWNAFGTSPVPTTNQLKNSILCQEPQII